jgi:hypothetical protein
LQIENCKLKIENGGMANQALRLALPFVQFAIFNLQFSICNSFEAVQVVVARPRIVRVTGLGE